MCQEISRLLPTPASPVTTSRSRPALDDAVPELDDLVKLSIAPPPVCPSVPWAAGTGNLRAVKAEQSLRERLCGLRRPDLQLVFQNLRALVVGAHGARLVARVRLQLHQGAVSNFFRRL